MTQSGPPGWLSTRQCAVQIGVSTSFIRGEIRDGRLRAQQLVRDGKRPVYRVALSDFRVYLTQHWTSTLRSV